MRMNCLWNNIKVNESKTIRLKDCRVVIDGQNYFFSTYEASKLPFVFGAEANEYAKFLKKDILEKFKNANVKCYIIFKGSDTEIDKKIKKLWLSTFDFGANYHYEAPVLMKEIYKQVLEELGFKYATSVMESKDDCVALAQALNCPVLSEDKEFYFKAASYIPYKTIDYTRGNNYITCDLYNIKEFFNKYLLTDKKVAMFLALSDENVFPQNYFNLLLRSWNIIGPTHQTLPVQLQKMLKYFSEHNDFEVLNSILKLFTTEAEKNKFMSRIEEFEKTQYSDNVIVNFLMDPEPRQHALWFERGVASQKIATDYVYLYKHKCIMGSWAIEKKDTVDSIMLSIDIIKYAYNLLTNFKPSEITVYQSREKYIKVNSTQYDIEKPMYQCKESVFENGWTDIKRFKLFEHFLVKNNINMDMIDKIPEDAKMLIIALVYFARKKASENIMVRKEVYCFIISYVMLNVVLDEPQSFRKRENGISETDCNIAKKVTELFFHYDNIEAKQIFNENTLKTLVEMQYCLLHMNYLNTLCGSPFTTTKYHRTFNGTFIYKLLTNMNKSNEDQFIAALFMKAPSVFNVVNSLISSYKELL